MQRWVFAALGAGAILFFIFKNKATGGQMQLSDKGLVFIAEHEGWSPVLYDDAASPPNATIGYGHLVHKGPVDGSESEAFQRGITKQRGLELLREDAGNAERVVNENVVVPLTQDQFDALVSFVYNVGEGNFLKSSVLTSINAGDFASVPDKLALWNKAGGKVLAGLSTRREDEGLAFA